LVQIPTHHLNSQSNPLSKKNEKKHGIPTGSYALTPLAKMLRVELTGYVEFGYNFQQLKSNLPSSLFVHNWFKNTPSLRT
jgi:hypothetical protein